ncbi:MAG: MFS transporter [Rubripirellula sp.]|nr:MFS transporter [Rubripirellula sp.]
MAAKQIKSSSNEKWVLVTTVLASAMAFIDATALNVALPAIQSQTHATGTELFWIVNSYAVVTAALILFGGALGDGFGRKRIFAIGISVFVAASLGCGLSQSTNFLVVARALQGLGAALMIPGSLALISATFPMSKRGRAIGIWSASSVVMTALGPIIGGLLADSGWWRAIFFINLPIGVLSLAALLTKVTVPVQPRVRSVDYAGAVLGILAVAGINFALLEVSSRGWRDPVVISLLVSGIVCLGMFLWHESKIRSPLLPLDLFRNRKFRAACQLTVCFYSGLYAMLFFLALNLIQVQDYSATVAGTAQLPVMVLVILLSPIAGSLVDRYGPRLPLTLGGFVAGIGFVLLGRSSLTGGPMEYWTSFFPPLLLLGAAMGLCAAPLSTTIMNSVPPENFGIASGINSMLSRLSSVLGIAVLGPIAIMTFRSSLMQNAKVLLLDERCMSALRQESWRLADAVPPTGMSPDMTIAVQNSIRLAYLDAFRIVSFIAAAVVITSTLLAAMRLKNHTTSD